MEVYEFPVTPEANESSAGLLRTAGETDEKNCQCADAAITPCNLYKLSDFRRANKAYAVGDIVACPYHAALQLKCTIAGTTASEVLNTEGVGVGSVITDGAVSWAVEPIGGSIVANYGEMRIRDSSKPTYGLG